MEPPQELSMLPPGAVIPGAGEPTLFIRNNNNVWFIADMNAPYNQVSNIGHVCIMWSLTLLQHIQQSGLPLSPGMEPNPSLIPQPQLDHNQPYFHVRSMCVSINHSLNVGHHLRGLMLRNGDLIHKGDFLNTEDHQAVITGGHREVQQSVVEEVGILHCLFLINNVIDLFRVSTGM